MTSIRAQLCRRCDTGHVTTCLRLGDGQADANALKGMEPAELACQVLDAIAQGRAELIAGAGLDARIAIWLRAIAPNALFALMRLKAGK